MLHFHIPVKIIRLLRLAMTSTESQVRVQTNLIGSITIKQGLKQRYDLAPMLFNLVLKFILRRLRFDLKGLIECKSTQDLTYADDIAILSCSLSDMMETYNELAVAVKEMGLEISTNKTKLLIQSRMANK
jgi:hypothetical protein